MSLETHRLRQFVTDSLSLVVVSALTFLALLLCPVLLLAQTETSTHLADTVKSTNAEKGSKHFAGVRANSPMWHDLSSLQQESLLPLRDSWDKLEDRPKRKWIAIAKNYSSLAPLEQSKLHSRMAEWAALNQQARARARFNFLESKKIHSDRMLTWERYQSLSPQDRESFAAKVRRIPSGAAALVKPTSLKSLARAPVIPGVPVRVHGFSFSIRHVDPHTLLPLTNLVDTDLPTP